jgi:membrane protein DedA with SNARE-associated domain
MSRASFAPMLHELIRTWFHWVDVWGYAGVFVLMMMESSIIPVPSEVVLPPAAFWAAQGRMSMAGVILAATTGSYVGSVLSYWISQWVGQPLIHKYGKYVHLDAKKLKMAEAWVRRFGSPGVFFARLLPVVRHLVSIPAGILRMPFGRFSMATLTGAGLWCSILCWFGQEVIGGNPELLQSPELMMMVIKAKMHLILAGIVVLGGLYAAVIWFKKKGEEPTLRTKVLEN